MLNFTFLIILPPFSTIGVRFHICSYTLVAYINYIKYGPRSDCSKGSSLIRVYSVCFHEPEVLLNIK